MKKILQLGIDENSSSSLKKKLYNTNFLALAIGGFMCLPFMVLTFFMFKPVFFLPAICLTVCALVLLLNSFGIHKIGRVILGITPFTLTIFFHAILLPAGSPKIMELYSLSFCFLLVPFLLFDIKQDKGLLAFCAVYSLVTIVFFSDYLNATFESDINIDLIKDGTIGKPIIFLSVAMVYLVMVAQSYQSMLEEQEAQQVISKMHLQAEAMKQSESELEEKVGEVEQSQAEEKKRNWASEGLAQISAILREEHDTQKLYDKLVSYLTEYMNGNQCALFLVDEEHDQTQLVMQATYAYSRKKYVEKTVKPGQGMVGQVYLEKETIYLKDIPSDYMTITSGMGEGTPTEALITPLIVNEQIEGVIEIASFSTFEQYQIDFLEQLGETLASFININRINQKTKVLLEEAQQQTEEMMSQEEEMRQNMEELSATQEEMGRKEQEYLNQIQTLEQELESLKSEV